MFSKALFKQSCKANGVMWTIITFAVCFMLACVMLISGNGGIGDTKDAIQDTIITKEIDASLKDRAINYYALENDGLMQFDCYFVENAQEGLTYHAKFQAWQNEMPKQEDFSSIEDYSNAITAWQEKMPMPTETVEQLYAKNYNDWMTSKPKQEDYDSTDAYQKALLAWQEKNPSSVSGAVTASYTVALGELQSYMLQKAETLGYAKDSEEAQEMLGTVMYNLNPNHLADAFYLMNNEPKPTEYDVTSLVAHMQAGDIETYMKSEERMDYIQERSEECSAIFLAGNMTLPSNVDKIIKQLSSFGVDKEKYDSFNYTYATIKHLAKTTIVTYQGRLNYEIDSLNKKYEGHETVDGLTYDEAYQKMNQELLKDVTSSLLSSLPQEVSDALKEVGQMDLFGLVVGSIYYKLAGILLPIIFMIMASNNLISSQVDTGSMAYVLSTSTKRKTVAFTQAVYLVSSLFAMFALTTLTGGICLAFVHEEVALTLGKLVLLNVGAFLVLFCLSGLCFLTSCFFDRSKRSMAIGGGLSIFALVAAMLGLFGSQVIPSVVRLESLNSFNYVTVISLFDVVSILDGTTAFIYKLAILFVLGIIGYFLGTKKFIKKDLPL